MWHTLPQAKILDSETSSRLCARKRKASGRRARALSRLQTSLGPTPCNGVGRFLLKDAPRACVVTSLSRELPPQQRGLSRPQSHYRAKVKQRVPMWHTLRQSNLAELYFRVPVGPFVAVCGQHHLLPLGRVATASRMKWVQACKALPHSTKALDLGHRSRALKCTGLLPQRAFPPSEARTSLRVSWINTNGLTVAAGNHSRHHETFPC